jgi:hypothetical protein
VFSNGVVACSVSASFGISGLPDARVSRTDDVVRLAAQALAEAKRRGRDRIVADLPQAAIAPAPLPATQKAATSRESTSQLSTDEQP